MSVKSFKFVSPGVFINEIDNSFIPKSADAIGPVIIGRSTKGLAMQPIKVESYSDFVEMFGDTVPGKAGGDISRDGNQQSPMYGTYAAKAFLNANVAPLTYVRLLGQQASDATTTGKAGWKTAQAQRSTVTPSAIGSQTGSGGTYGLWVFPKYSAASSNLGTGSLAAIWYVNTSASLMLSGALGAAGTLTGSAYNMAGVGLVVAADSNNEFTMIVSSSLSNSPYSQKLVKFGFDDTKQSFMRKRFNTNPQLVGTPGVIQGSSSYEAYWLGESFEQELRDASAVSAPAAGVLLPINLSGAVNAHPGNLKFASREAVAGWFVGQDIDNNNSAWKAELSKKLFRLKGRGHGEWLQKNVKISISNIKVSNSSLTDYGTFSIVLRSISDSDGAPQIIERYDNLNLDPASPNYVARKLGDQYESWDATNRRLIRYGTYENQSRYVYVEMNSDVDDGATNAKLLPIGYYGPPKLRDFPASSYSTANGGQVTTSRYCGWSDRVVGSSHTSGAFTAYKTPGNISSSTSQFGNDMAESFLSGSSSTTTMATFTITLSGAPGTGEYLLISGKSLSASATAGSDGSNTFCQTGSTATITDDIARAINYASNHFTTKLVTAVSDGANLVTLTAGSEYRGTAGNSITLTEPAGMASVVVAAGVTGVGAAAGYFSGSLNFPTTRLRNSASDGGLSSPTTAFWGWQNTRTANSTQYDPSCADTLRYWITSSVSDIASSGVRYPAGYAGVQAFSEVFSLLNICTSSSPAGAFYYSSGSYSGPDTGTGLCYSYVRATAGRSLEDLLNLGYNQFTAPLHGGYDGFDVTKPDPLYNAGIGTTAPNSYTYHTWKQAIDTVRDPEYINMNLLAAPGLTNDTLTNHMMNICEARGDAMSLIDLANVYIPSHEAYKSTKSARLGTTPTNAAKALRDRRIDTSYGATFYPWVQTRDENTGRLLWIPPSVAMMGVLASSQAKSDVWFAPAGFNRGGLSDGAAGIPVTAVTERLVSKDRDTLYESRINPIASFPNSGIVVFGQKTLQERASALDRINVRRLVIYLKKQISILSTQILFEQNVQATWNRFTSLIEPFLANVKVQFGITDYKLILDSSTTTPDLVDQNILYAKIMIKPARAIEYIAIDFVVASTGASFDD
jgi:hypothetical protein|tara:strand:+ start:1406 stop:4798 length:3393 start_codon:yes stop_codon:yes gene_type:complete